MSTLSPSSAADGASSAPFNPRAMLRRRGSSLPGDPRGDTGGTSLSTMDTSSKLQDKRPTKRRKARSPLARFGALALKHTWLVPLIIISTILSLYALNPTATNPVRPLIFLSYPLARNDPLAADNYMRPYWRDTTQYGKGGLDFVFVGFYMVVLTFTREFIMQRILRPWTIYLQIRNKTKQARFMEQAYTAIYFAVFGPYGLYVMSRSPVWYFNTTAMFETYPNRAHEGLFKAYYLLQASYWAQQAVVLMLQLEKPRKDFKELVAHHIITVSLIWLSYRFHFTYMGIAVYITHDVSDFFLATSKMLNYVESIATPYYFATFVCIWAYCRHYLNLCILYATATEFRTVGPWELNWATQQYKCWISQPITLGLLGALQAVNIFWFVLILRILKRALFDGVEKDERSDYGEDEPAAESTEEKRERMGLLRNEVPVETDENAPPAASTRSRARDSFNGTALSPSPEETPSKAASGRGSTRRRKA